MLNEKEGLVEDSLSEELKKILYKDYSSNIGKASVNLSINFCSTNFLINIIFLYNIFT